MDEPKELNPEIAVCVCKHPTTNDEVGRIPAAAPNAESYITDLSRFYGGLGQDYVEDESFCTAWRMIHV